MTTAALRTTLGLALFGVLVAASACSSSEKPTNTSDVDGIPCRQSADCPPQLRFCIDGACSAGSSETDTAEEEARVDADPDDRTDDEVQPICEPGLECCSDLDCVIPNRPPGSPRRYCDRPGTPQSKCKEDAVCPPEFECCSSLDCVEGKNGQGFAGNPNRCSYYICELNTDGRGGTCKRTFDCEITTRRCATPVPGDPASAGRYQVCSLDEKQCKFWKTEQCPGVQDCEESSSTNIECVYSGRCTADTDCIENFECKDTPAGKRCVLKQAPFCGVCSRNGAVVAECDTSGGPLLCCTGLNQNDPNTGYCDRPNPQGQCAGECRPQ